MNWQPLDLDNIPQSPGVYGFQVDNRWLYIGQAKNLRKRLHSRHIPLTIALRISEVKIFHQLTDSPQKLERFLIKELNPEWNGGTSFEIYGAGPACDIGLTHIGQEQMDEAIAKL
jgi:excinuclease UvrABC nuclease subunit